MKALQVRTTDIFGLVEEELQKHDSGRKSSFRYGQDRTDLNIRVFMDVDPAEQQKRILTRNGPEMLPRFISEWIPKEELYFKTFRIKEKCSICLTEIPHFPFM